MDPSPQRPLKITNDELDRAVPLSMRGFAASIACPVCGITNDGAAIECRSCGEPFDARSHGEHKRRKSVPRCPPEEIHAARVSATVLFVVSLLAVLAPAVIVLGVLLLARRHRPLVQAGPAFVALAYSAVLLSLVYSGLAIWAVVN